MQKDQLPQYVDPSRFVEKAKHLEGVIPVGSLQRLHSSLGSDEGEVYVQLDFGVDEQGIKYLKGHVEARLTLQCQRCMNPLVCEIMDDFLSGLVESEAEAKRLPSQYDPLLVEEGTLALHEVVEDELIISLPIVPLHDDKDCHVQTPYVIGSEEKTEMKSDSPYKVIESLKARHKQE